MLWNESSVAGWLQSDLMKWDRIQYNGPELCLNRWYSAGNLVQAIIKIEEIKINFRTHEAIGVFMIIWIDWVDWIGLD